MTDRSLQSFIESHTSEDYARVQDDLGNGFVRLKAAEAQRRQAKQDIRSFEDVVIEMLRNARDAHAKAIFVATWATKDQRFLTMLDDGDGVPADLQGTIFEPFVTSKLDSFHSDRWGVHGRGMALYSIRQNTDTSRVVASAPGFGSVFSVTSSFSRLGEKRDQSSTPSITFNEDGNPVLRGPHNILRTVLEFSIEERSSVAVYLGSAAEIVSTLYWLGRSAAQSSKDPKQVCSNSLPYIHRFGLCEDAASLTQIATELRLPISARTAYRIMNGEIKPLPTHLQAMLGESKKSAEPVLKPSKRASFDTKPIRISREDAERFGSAVMEQYVSLADAYYLATDVEPSIHCLGGDLVIRIPLRHEG